MPATHASSTALLHTDRRSSPGIRRDSQQLPLASQERRSMLAEITMFLVIRRSQYSEFLAAAQSPPQPPKVVEEAGSAFKFRIAPLGMRA